MPHVDKRLYARENGWMIAALCELYAVTGDAKILEEAERSAHWVSAHRTRGGGGFSHGEHNAAGPYLADTLAMGQALLALYEVTGDRKWLKQAEAARQFIASSFAAGGGGFVTSEIATGHAYKPHPERDENAQLARFANLLYQYTGNQGDRQTAARAMRYLATHEVAMVWLSAPVLLAEMQFTSLPTHITIVGRKKDASAKALFQTALSTGPVYKRVEWWDPTEGPLPRADVQYPSLPHSEAFLCTATGCSSPLSNPQVLEARLHKATE